MPGRKSHKNIVLLSLGQIVNSDINKSVTAFAEIVKEQRNGKGLFSPHKSVKFALLADKLWHGTIDKYKAGKINFTEFHNKLDKQLGIKTTDEQFKSAWNAMCGVSTSNIDNLKKILDLQKEYGFLICIPSVTNQEHFNNITLKLKEHGIDIEANKNIAITTSFNDHTLNFRRLAKHSLTDAESKAEYKMNNFFVAVGIDNVLSLHSGINKKSDLVTSYSIPSGAAIVLGKRHTFKSINPTKQSIADTVEGWIKKQKIETNVSRVDEENRFKESLMQISKGVDIIKEKEQKGEVLKFADIVGGTMNKERDAQSANKGRSIV